MYLGLDAWQLPNGFDVLGTVLYQLVKGKTGSFELETMPLNIVWLKERHTSVYLAKTVHLIGKKIGVQNKAFHHLTLLQFAMCVIVIDNASNNKTMIGAIKKYKRAQFKGKGQWVRCFAHILTLIAQVIWHPFGSHKKKTQSNSASHKSDTEDNNLDPDDIEDMNEVGDDGDDDADKTQLAGKMALEQIPNIDEIKLETDNIVDFSDEEDDDRWRYSSQSGKDTLAKFQSIARKLNKSPNSKALFVDICREKGCLKPHNVKRDQKHKCHGTLRAHHRNQAGLDVARDLITSHLLMAISDPRAEYPPALRNACRAGLQLTNKCYTLADCSPLYWVAMILHPSFKDEYFKLAHWKPKWIVELIRLACKMWELHYKPSPHPTTAKQLNHRPRVSRSISLPTFSTPELTQRTLASLKSQSTPSSGGSDKAEPGINTGSFADGTRRAQLPSSNSGRQAIFQFWRGARVCQKTPAQPFIHHKRDDFHILL
ncbi:hypothetical protein PSTG_02772 [Puccinia striiformis f. sp. tritici PST-78]|uniref:DUF659 domain-containing protein n=1 Tax=Puccinia striiformis f. sp. tritici PST-78 TaxID=1165861 RepID=A0A0L0VY06_9BASI|nr:hypothetical protein PSTG_02772 [Puccinia striiformis f. sp. tritici PST-78]